MPDVINPTLNDERAARARALQQEIDYWSDGPDPQRPWGADSKLLRTWSYIDITTELLGVKALSREEKGKIWERKQKKHLSKDHPAVTGTTGTTGNGGARFLQLIRRGCWVSSVDMLAILPGYTDFLYRLRQAGWRFRRRRDPDNNRRFSWKLVSEPRTSKPAPRSAASAGIAPGVSPGAAFERVKAALIPDQWIDGNVLHGLCPGINRGARSAISHLRRARGYQVECRPTGLPSGAPGAHQYRLLSSSMVRLDDTKRPRTKKEKSVQRN